LNNNFKRKTKNGKWKMIDYFLLSVFLFAFQFDSIFIAKDISAEFEVDFTLLSQHCIERETNGVFGVIFLG
jgi:hypothetical protein